MKFKRGFIIGLLFVIGVAFLSGCGKDEEPIGDPIEDLIEESIEEPIEEISDYGFLSGGRDFVLRTPNFNTSIQIEESSRFYGDYHGFDANATGKDYPNGTIYYSFFGGELEPAIKLDEYTYEFEVSEIRYDEEVGEKEILYEQRMVCCIAYGIADTKKIRIYVPGTPLSQLPDEFIDSVSCMELIHPEDDVLKYYGLYSVDTKMGMLGIPLDD